MLCYTASYVECPVKNTIMLKIMSNNSSTDILLVAYIYPNNPPYCTIFYKDCNKIVHEWIEDIKVKIRQIERTEVYKKELLDKIFLSNVKKNTNMLNL